MERETSSGEKKMTDLCREFANEKNELVAKHEAEVSESNNGGKDYKPVTYALALYCFLFHSVSSASLNSLLEKLDELSELN